MGTKINKLLLIIVLVYIAIIQCSNQHFSANQKFYDDNDQNLGKRLTQQQDQLQMEASQSGYIQVQPIEYLQNILTLDTLIYYIYCNHTISYQILKQKTMGLINSQGNHSIEHSQLCDEVIKEQKQQQDRIQKNCCLFCGKQFKNSTYLAIHYLIQHPSLLISNRKLSKKLKLYQLPGKYSMKNIIYRIMQNPILEKITDIELNLLFSSSNPQTQTYQYCQFLFSNVFNTTSLSSEKWLQRYRQFMRKGKSSQLCNIIAYRMYEISIWVKIGKYVGFVVVFFSLMWCIMIGSQKRNQKQRIYKRKKHKSERY